MSLITDPLYIIHTSRIKFLRMDERGERIISFPPTVMSDDYIRLAAPIYPEMQYCYSPVYNNYLSHNASHIDGSSKITTSPRTTKRNYRQRNKPSTQQQPYNNNNNNKAFEKYSLNTITTAIQNGRSGRREDGPKSATTDSEDDDIEVDRQLLLSNSGKPIETTIMSALVTKDNEATEEEEEEEEEEEGLRTEDNILETATSENTSIINRSLSFRPISSSSLHPSVDSTIDPSPRFSIDNHNIRTEQQQQEEGSTSAVTGAAETAIVPASIDTTVDISSIHEVEAEVAEQDIIKEEQETMKEEGVPAPLEYTKKMMMMINKSVPMSTLSALIAEKATKAKNPFSDYSFVSGKGESKSIKLCVYLPHSKDPYKPVSLVVRPDAITDDVIGYILYDYIEEKRQPELKDEEYDLAEWCLLIAEDDGEIEDDLPAIDRTRNIGRVSFDQFALCRATLSQSKQNDLDRAKMGRQKVNLNQKQQQEEAESELENNHLNAVNDEVIPPIQSSLENAEIAANILIENNLSPNNYNNNEDALTTNKEQERDASNVAVPIPSTKATLTKATMPMTPLKYFRIKLMTSEEVSATTAIPVYAEMFIGDVLELVSRKRKLDPNEYMLTIADSNVIVSNDTTVESMKGITDLTLVKKNTTLNVPTATSTHLWRSPIKRKKDEVNHPMYFTSTTSNSTTKLMTGTSSTNDALLSQYKKYTVSRKMPMFVSKRLYIMAIDGDYIHLMPPEHKGMFDSVKTTSFHAGAIRSCKQSKKVPTNFKIIILKERDFKTYDLEAESPKEASEICSRLRFLMQVTKGA